MLSKVRYLLLQVRNPDDPMAPHEIESFSKVLRCETANIAICDLLNTAPTARQLDTFDVILIGGSGDYSATKDAPWLDRTFESLREIHARCQPMFGSCWGFQALARALDGEVITDMEHAELGTLEVALTDAGKADPVFGPLGDAFIVPIGHQDCVVRLPTNCTLLGKTDKAKQIYRFDDAPIYATQFHPELDRNGLIDRIRTYRKYVERITKSTFEEFILQCQETPRMDEILRRFVRHVLGEG
jgi:GMP synthase (glutamine-hydrolysing)